MDNSDITDQFSCPVCLEIPPAEIFQCCNGHTVCSDCFKNISSCPECRVKYGNVKIRNRALEAILNTRKLCCPNKHLGCSKELKRNEISGHLKLCEFSEATVPLCKILGYTCNFKTSTKNTSEVIQHFTRVHNSATFEIGHAVKIKLENFAKTDFNKCSVWTPVLFVETNNVDMKGTCILFASINGEDKTVSIISLALGVRQRDCNAYVGHFALNSNNEGQIPVEWATSIVTLYDAEQAVNQPLFIMRQKILRAQYMKPDGSLEILTVIKRKQASGVTLAGVTTRDTVHVLNEQNIVNDVPAVNVSSSESDDDE